ncbi:hypothetical protein AGLY_015198, partial [Aphis glycines]
VKNKFIRDRNLGTCNLPRTYPPILHWYLQLEVHLINHNSLELIAEIFIITNLSQSPISINSLYSLQITIKLKCTISKPMHIAPFYRCALKLINNFRCFSLLYDIFICVSTSTTYDYMLLQTYIVVFKHKQILKTHYVLNRCSNKMCIEKQILEISPRPRRIIRFKQKSQQTIENYWRLINSTYHDLNSKCLGTIPRFLIPSIKKLKNNLGSSEILFASSNIYNSGTRVFGLCPTAYAVQQVQDTLAGGSPSAYAVTGRDICRSRTSGPVPMSQLLSASTTEYVVVVYNPSLSTIQTQAARTTRLILLLFHYLLLSLLLWMLNRRPLETSQRPSRLFSPVA